ncbi:hypothetical protein MNBD_GAMMA21-700 [hydrothermal vent metagenome]|uniref:Uncharacterized protein n=1 Tax=hydrothermal vent metagenome TaxID=652676 RepID=A0A3B1A8Q1_9ZZZZ
MIMPTAIKVISSLSIMFTSIFAANVMFINKSQLSLSITGAPLLIFINLFAIGVLVVLTFVLLLRASRFVGFVRVLVYALLLVLGLDVLLMLKYLTEGYGILTILLNVVVIVFLIGVRGYLNSGHALRYFWRE